MLIKRDSAEWDRMWTELFIQQGDYEGWQYIGTEQNSNGLWFHLFRHTYHPRTHRTVVVKVLAQLGGA